jgi:hypothetical protein
VLLSRRCLRTGGRLPSEGPIEFESFKCEMRGGIVMVLADGKGAHIGTSYHSQRSSTIM